MTQTTSQIGRSKLEHPDLGFDTEDDGVALHNAMSLITAKVSNDLPSRWTGNITLLNSASTTINHYFNLAIDKITITIFEDGVQLTEAQKASNYNITQSTINSIAIQNISGESKTFDALIFAYKISITESNLDPSYSPVTTPILILANGTLSINNSYVSRLSGNTTQILPECNGSNQTISIINSGSGVITLQPATWDYVNGYQGNIKLYENDSIMLRDCNWGSWKIEYLNHESKPYILTEDISGYMWPGQKYIVNETFDTTKYLVNAYGTNRTIEIQNINSGIVTIDIPLGTTVNGLKALKLYPNKSFIFRDCSVDKWICNVSDDLVMDMQLNTGAQDVKKWLAPLLDLHIKNKNTSAYANTYIHGATAVDYAYKGGVYSPTQNRIYLVPCEQSNQTNWHYINCDTGEVVAYAHGATVGSSAYETGIYSPTQNRIYFMPYGQSGQSNWHYVDCATGNIVAYLHGATVTGNYMGGVYSPTQNRIYLVPNGQSSRTIWHYIDCNTGNVVAYTHGATVNNNGYMFGVYSPTQNRIYFIPSGQWNKTIFHYIDCNTGDVVSYIHGTSFGTSLAYYGGVYSPTQNRIYFIPYSHGYLPQWHYIDCNTGSVVTYTHGATALQSAYIGGIYSPAQNRIYLVPAAQANQTNWHYIDCSTGSVVAYVHGVTAVQYAYEGAVYSPKQNRIYFVPTDQADIATWHYLQCTGDNTGICDHQVGSVMLNNNP